MWDFLSVVAQTYNSLDKVAQLQKAMELLKVTQAQGAQAAPRSMEEAKRKSYAFWDTQPVPKIGMHLIICLQVTASLAYCINILFLVLYFKWLHSCVCYTFPKLQYK